MSRLKLVAFIAFACSASMALAMGAKPKGDDEALSARIQPVAKLELAAPTGSGPKGAKSGEEIVKAVCGACHQTGAAGAPKIGDKAAWAPRLGMGLDGLLKSALAGKNAMPAKGGADVTDNELARAIVFMTNKSGANFKEPKEPALKK